MGGTAPLTGKPSDIAVLSERVKELKCDVAETNALLSRFINDWHENRLASVKLQSDLFHGIDAVRSRTENAHGRLDKVEPKVDALELNTVPSIQAVSKRAESAHERLDEVDPKVETLEKKLAPLIFSMRIVTWIGSALGLAIIALIVSIITGQVHLTF